MTAHQRNRLASAPGIPDQAIDQPLPVDLSLAGGGWWARYRHYPVFSTRWLLGRCLRFGLCIGAISVLIGASFMVIAHSAAIGALVGLHFFAGFMAMVVVGPALASAMRARHWPARSEQAGVAACVLFGIALAFFADRWSSAYIAQALLQAGQLPPRRPAAMPAGARLGLLAVNLTIRGIIYALLGGGVAVFALAEERRRLQARRHAHELAQQHEQRRQAQWKLGLLQAQVEPHFLFNTLASIRAMVRAQPDQAEHAIDTLVDYLRGTIPRLREDGEGVPATLGQQLELCRGYLELMRLRSGGRLDYVIDADESLLTHRFAPLLLIILVENAVKHGTEPRRGPGMIRVVADRPDDGCLRVCVSDDGLGLRDSHGNGMGLRNLREQLQARYGDRAAFVLRSGRHGGAEAELSIPDEGTA